MAYNEKNLGRGEKVVYQGHKHVLLLIKAAFQWIALFIVAIIAAIFIGVIQTTLTDTPKLVLVLVAIATAFVSLIAFGISYLVWAAEQYIITNERVVRVEGIINKKETATSLDKVNDVETDQTLFGRMFNYGQVRILTGSDEGVNVLDFLARPHEFKKIMLNAKNKYYGDASDLAPRATGRRYDDEEEADRNSRGRDPRQEGRVYNAPPPQASYQGQIDPRGYAPPAQQPQPRPQPPQPQYYAQPAPPQQSMSPQQIAETIQQLARLRDSGVISEAEFQSKKNDLMNRL